MTREEQSEGDKPIILYEGDNHRNILLPVLDEHSSAIPCNQHLIVHWGHGMLLDPGGHKLFPQAQAVIEEILDELDAVVLSHQDPDIVASLNGWLLLSPNTVAYISKIWERFVPHFGVADLVEQSMVAVADEGGWVDLNGAPIALLPAHFLHSCGNLQVYDPTSKILYTGDLGASVGQTYQWVHDFDEHVPFMLGFHQRYMASPAAMKAWAKMARQLDINIIAPQHGALLSGKPLIARFIDWVEGLECGASLILDKYQLPDRSLVYGPPERNGDDSA